MTNPHKISEESLLQFGLFGQLFADDLVEVVPRPVSFAWRYGRHVNASGGWNPFYGKIYYPGESCAATWLEEPARRYQSARDFNTDDQLPREAAFLLHDYLHHWAIHWIKSLVPEIGFGEAPITKENFEDFVFCLLLTEAVATVGVDYWYFCDLDFNEQCPIGSNFESLTTAYHSRHTQEYQHHYPELAVQHPEFFSSICTFFSTGSFVGFSQSHMERSPQVFSWLRKELVYGSKQRAYVRQWLSFLSQCPEVQADQAQPFRPVRCDKPWQLKLARDIGERLWSKIKSNEKVAPPGRLETTWFDFSPSASDIDYRFYSGLKAYLRGDSPAISEQQFAPWFSQILLFTDIKSCPPEAMRRLPELWQKRDADLVRTLFRDLGNMSQWIENEPYHVFLLA